MYSIFLQIFRFLSIRNRKEKNYQRNRKSLKIRYAKVFIPWIRFFFIHPPPTTVRTCMSRSSSIYHSIIMHIFQLFFILFSITSSLRIHTSSQRSNPSFNPSADLFLVFQKVTILAVVFQLNFGMSVYDLLFVLMYCP